MHQTTSTKEMIVKTVLSDTKCPKHKCKCVLRGGQVVCLKCEDEKNQKQFSNQPGHGPAKQQT